MHTLRQSLSFLKEFGRGFLGGARLMLFPLMLVHIALHIVPGYERLIAHMQTPEFRQRQLQFWRTFFLILKK